MTAVAPDGKKDRPGSCKKSCLYGYVEAAFGTSMVDAMDGLQRVCVATQDSLFLFRTAALAFEFPGPKVHPASSCALNDRFDFEGLGGFTANV